MSIPSSTFRIVSGGDVASGLAADIALPAAKRTGRLPAKTDGAVTALADAEQVDAVGATSRRRITVRITASNARWQARNRQQPCRSSGMRGTK